MNFFVPKKIGAKESLGEKLRLARQSLGLEIEVIAKKINIRSAYLSALEEERFDLLPAGLYGKNFLKEYANFLNLDYQELSKGQDELASEQNKNPFSQKIVEKSKFLVFPKIIKNILLFVVGIICFLYLLFYLKKVFLAPDLVVSQPERNILISENSLLIKGETEPEAEVKINGETILNNNNGRFSQIINLKKGLNDITISAQKKYSREKTVVRQILVE